MLDALRRPRLVRQLTVTTLAVVAAVAILLYRNLQAEDADDTRHTQASLTQLAGLLRDVAAAGDPGAIPALVRGWLHTETGVVQVTVYDPQGRRLADVAHEARPAHEARHPVDVDLASGAALRVDVVMDDTAAAAARRDAIRVHVFGGAAACLVAWALLVFAGARRAAVRRYKVLLATSRLLLSGTSEQELLQRLCELAATEGGFVLAWIGMVGYDGQIVPAASAGRALGYLVGLRVSADPSSPIGHGIGGRVTRLRAPVVSNDVWRDPSMVPWATAARAHGIRSAVAVPLLHGSSLLGIMGFYSGEAGFFTAAEVALAEQVAADIGFAIDYLRRGVRLAATLERLGHIETEVRAGSFRFQVPDGSLWCSDGAARLFSRPAGSSVYAPPAAGEIDADPLATLFDLMSVTTAGNIELDVPLALGDDAQRWLRVTGAVEMAAAGGKELRGLVQDVSERKALEIGITFVADAERQRIASELHDNLGQILSGTSLLLMAFERRAAALDASLGLEMRQVSDMLKKALGVCRALAHKSAPDFVHGLGSALVELARQASTAVVQCEATIAPLAGALHGGQATELYRIAQEAVTNALKHSGCTRITIDLGMAERLIDLRIADDGIGLQPGSGANDGLGHRTMRYRAARAGGTILFGPGPAGGFVVRVRARVQGSTPR